MKVKINKTTYGVKSIRDIVDRNGKRYRVWKLKNRHTIKYMDQYLKRDSFSISGKPCSVTIGA